jgi:tRNA uridine 5-carboxymethylaminomethyl modification enzyme
MPSLSAEIKEKLTKIRPKTLSQAARIDGITPASLSFILAFIKNRAKLKKFA